MASKSTNFKQLFSEVDLWPLSLLPSFPDLIDSLLQLSSLLHSYRLAAFLNDTRTPPCLTAAAVCPATHCSTARSASTGAPSVPFVHNISSYQQGCNTVLIIFSLSLAQ